MSMVSSASGTAVLVIKMPTPDELATFKCDMQRKNVLEKVPELREDLEMRHESIAELFAVSEADLTKSLLAPTHDFLQAGPAVGAAEPRTADPRAKLLSLKVYRWRRADLCKNCW